MGQFIVYSASAGSGKTYNIVKSYISLLLGKTGTPHKHILAVTFTNKAGEEMKSRIISELDKIANNKESSYFQELQDELNLSRDEISKRAMRVFKQILHDYSFFAVSTIDSFYQKILKSFTYETGIQYNYEIELDINNVINQVVDNLIVLSAKDAELKQHLFELINQNIIEGKRWDIRFSLKNFISEIYNSEYRSFEKEYERFFSEGKNIVFKKELNKTINNFENSLNNFLEEFDQIIKSAGLSLEDFSGGNSRSIAKRILNIKNILISKDIPDFFKGYDDISKWLRKPDRDDAEKSRVVNLLIEKLESLKMFFEENYYTYYLASSIKKQYYYLNLINYAFIEISNYKTEHNKFMISEVPMFLADISQNNSSSFIYEKIGTFYYNYLIDEFQDTSKTQWDAFSPLIEESLSHVNDNKNILVGDVKQSIYGWRGGDWELLGEKVEQQFKNYFRIEPLIQNHRSRENIVSFNNAFFINSAKSLQYDFNNSASGSLPSNLDNKIEGVIYKDVKQEITKEGGGYVEINLIDGFENISDYQDKAMQVMIKQIEEIQLNNYSAGDIMILVRKNQEGKKIANFILEYSKSKEALNEVNYDVISAEFLYIDSNDAVTFIISCLKYIQNSEDRLSYAEAAYFYKNLTAPLEETNISEFNLHENSEAFDAVYSKHKKELSSSSLQELTDIIIKVFRLNDNVDNIPYITSLRDVIHDFGVKNYSDIPSFLEWWDEFGGKQTLKIPEKQNAINIITMHKSKGLSANFVLIPFCNWDLYSSKGIVWCPINQSPFDSLPVWPLNFNSNLKKGLTANEYEKERFNRTVESFNLLYVAYTRAKIGLYISIPDKEPKSGFKNVGDIVYHSVNNSDIIEKEKFTKTEYPDELITKYSKGKINKVVLEKRTNVYFDSYTVNLPAKQPLIKPFASIDVDRSFTSEQIKKGIVYHKLFEKIIERSDLSKVVEEFVNKGLIPKDEKSNVIEKFGELLSSPYVESWYDGSYNVMIEKDIISSTGESKRPDRIMTKNNHAIVVDYKFGKSESQVNIDQVKEYGRLLSELNYTKVEKYVWYVLTGVLIRVSDDNSVERLLLKEIG